MCASLRRAARALTQLYEQALRPLGLRATQFTVLQALEQAGEVSQGELGQMLVMDSTSLTRTLEIMRRRGWIVKRPGKDQRERRLSLSPAGRERLRSATPAWEKAQARLRQQLGTEPWTEFLRLTNQVTNIAK
ncbi:MAG TPA: MarR family transcriptional regulator [Terriglobales bacterium]|nr:MarR family transcriptional regulator [Terriglobales bacterium]